MALALFLLLTPSAFALEPGQILVVYNRTLPASRDLAEHYCQQRAVSRENLLPVDVPDVDEIARTVYNDKLRDPVRTAVRASAGKLQCVLCVYGVPLRVGPQLMSDADRKELERLQVAARDLASDLDVRKKALKTLEPPPGSPEDAILGQLLETRRGEISALQRKQAENEELQRRARHDESIASVDSELMLALWDNYPLSRWIVNPLYWQIPEANRKAQPQVLMTCRLDAPTPDICKRMLADSLAAEQKGLQGKVYIDARGLAWDQATDPGGTGYGGYDESMRETAQRLLLDGKMSVETDNVEALMPTGSGVDCALYCGWYSVRNYQPSCKFNRGAVAWHLASFECVSLRQPGKQWCGNLLRDGAAVTLGPVAEPYTIAFPKPAEFFTVLASGEGPLVECYARTTLLTSWMNVLIGDPLYTPFKNNRRFRANLIQPSPRGSQLFGPAR